LVWLHVPFELQVSVVHGLPSSHEMHADPPTPQAPVAVPETQLDPFQQPPLQHVPSWH
jgi:hypothetical protein